MTLYRLYLRTRIRCEFLAPGQIEFDPSCVDPADAGWQEHPTMICDEYRYSYVISGCDEFEAENDAVALAIAQSIRDAAGDLCDAFELWDDTRHIDQSRIVPLHAGAVCAERQDAIVQTEETLLNSRWAIARSRRLRAQFDELREAPAARSSNRD